MPLILGGNLVASQTPGISAVQFQRQLGLSRYETAFGILHKLRAGMVRPNQDRMAASRGFGLAAKAGVSTTRFSSLVPSRFVIGNREPRRTAKGRTLCRACQARRSTFVVESAVAPRTLTVTDDWSGYASLGKRGYEHFAVAECGDPEVAEDYLPIIHLVFANLKTWLIGIHHGVSHQIFKPISMSFTFRFNRRSFIQRLPLPLGIAAMSAHRPSMNSFRGMGAPYMLGWCVNRIGKL